MVNMASESVAIYPERAPDGSRVVGPKVGLDEGEIVQALDSDAAPALATHTRVTVTAFVRAEGGTLRSPCDPNAHSIAGSVEIQLRDGTGDIVSTTGPLQPQGWEKLVTTFVVPITNAYLIAIVLHRNQRFVSTFVPEGGSCVSTAVGIFGAGVVGGRIDAEVSAPRT